MEEIIPSNYGESCMNRKTIQTKVVKGTGEKDFFLEVDFDLPSADPLYKIYSIDTSVDVYETKLIKGNKIIFNAWINKKIVYKIPDNPSNPEGIATIQGRIAHITKEIPLAGFVDIDVKGCEKLNINEDFAEVLAAYVVGDSEQYLEKREVKYTDSTGSLQSFVPKIYKYSKIHEKLCVKIAFKVVRWEHLSIEVEGNHC